MSAVTAARAVETPFAVDIANAQMPSSAGSAHRFKIRDSLAGVLGDLAPARELFVGEAAFAIDAGFLN